MLYGTCVITIDPFPIFHIPTAIHRLPLPALTAAGPDRAYSGPRAPSARLEWRTEGRLPASRGGPRALPDGGPPAHRLPTHQGGRARSAPGAGGRSARGGQVFSHHRWKAPPSGDPPQPAPSPRRVDPGDGEDVSGVEDGSYRHGQALLYALHLRPRAVSCRLLPPTGEGWSLKRWVPGWLKKHCSRGIVPKYNCSWGSQRATVMVRELSSYHEVDLFLFHALWPFPWQCS